MAMMRRLRSREHLPQSRKAKTPQLKIGKSRSASINSSPDLCHKRFFSIFPASARLTTAQRRSEKGNDTQDDGGEKRGVERSDETQRIRRGQSRRLHSGVMLECQRHAKATQRDAKHVH